MIATPPPIEIVACDSNPDSNPGMKNVLCLRGSLGVADASALRAAATRFARPPAGRAAADISPIDISQVDISELASLDVSVMQILAALEAEFARQGRRLEMRGSPEAVRRQWESAGWSGFTS